MEKEFTTLDVWLSAFLKLRGINPNLRVVRGKVLFSFPATDQIYRLLAEFNMNPEVPVVDFVSNAKTLRGEMLTLKNSPSNV